MKPAFTVLAAVALISVAARADLDVTSCKSADGSTELLVATNFKGTYAAVTEKGHLYAAGAIRVIKPAPSTPGPATTSATGTVTDTPKGPVFELKGTGVHLIIAAPASHSHSELTLSGKMMEVDCQ